MLYRSLALALAGTVLLTVSPAAARDRMPTAGERDQIEQALRADGFVRWGKIELDDGRVWEVDDAIRPDGSKYDIELDKTMRVIKRDRY